jgi:hypothetical protein
VELLNFSDSEGDSDDSQPRKKSAASTDPTLPKGTLSKPYRLRLEAHLRKMTTSRSDIRQLMVFCIDHSECVDDIANTIIKSLTISSTPIFPTKIARLYLVSDLLHNSSTNSIPNAWKYRVVFEKTLEDVFFHLGGVWKSIEARLRAEQVRKTIYNVVDVWEKWNVFTRDKIERLKETFVEGGKSFTSLKEVKASEAQERDEKFRRDLQSQKDAKMGVFSLDDSESREMMANDEDEDVDGVPIQINPEESTSTSFPIRDGDRDDDGDEDDDVDGVPLTGTSIAPSAIAPIKSGFIPIAPIESIPSILSSVDSQPQPPRAPKASTTKKLITSKIFEDDDSE